MLSELKFTEARNSLTSVIDRVQDLFPVVIKPRKQSESHTLLLNETLVRQILQNFKFRIAVYQEDDGSVTLGMDDLELYVNGDCEEHAIDQLVEDLLTYAKQYMENPSRYFSAPNRRHHFPYLLKVLLCNNHEEVKQLLLDNAEFQRS